VSAQPVAPVIPPRTRSAGAGRARTGPPRRLPLASPDTAPSLPADAVYGLGRIDAWGRVGDREVIAVLGWQPGDRLTLTATAGVVTARRDPGGMVTMPSKPYLSVPAALRRRCGFRAGDRVLLAVFPQQGALAAYSLAVVDQAIRAWVPGPRDEGAGR
jgi:bifunctional DNA-binding transcriptional regulator/antitoxin component of YhaV-PrlF toxin-antitoxin module